MARKRKFISLSQVDPASDGNDDNSSEGECSCRGAGRSPRPAPRMPTVTTSSVPARGAGSPQLRTPTRPQIANYYMLYIALPWRSRRYPRRHRRRAAGLHRRVARPGRDGEGTSCDRCTADTDKTKIDLDAATHVDEAAAAPHPSAHGSHPGGACRACCASREAECPRRAAETHVAHTLAGLVDVGSDVGESSGPDVVSEVDPNTLAAIDELLRGAAAAAAGSAQEDSDNGAGLATSTEGVSAREWTCWRHTSSRAASGALCAPATYLRVDHTGRAAFPPRSRLRPRRPPRRRSTPTRSRRAARGGETTCWVPRTTRSESRWSACSARAAC